MSETVFEHMRTSKAQFRLLRSTQPDLGLHCPLTEPMDTTERMNGKQRPDESFAHAQDDLNLHIVRMLEGTFSFGTAHLCIISPR